MEKQILFEECIIHYTIKGIGEPVMFIHGFGEDGHIWDGIIEYLTKDFLCIIPDIPGSGKSMAQNWYEPTDEKFFSIEKMADCMNAILENEQIEKIMLAGHSMGGYIALAFAEKYFDKLSKLALIHTTTFADSEEKIQIRKRGIEFVRDFGAFNFLKQTISNLFSESFKQKNSGIVANLIEKVKYFSNDAIINYYEAMIKRKDRTFLLKDFSIPVLFVIGIHDKAVSPEDSLYQSSLPLQSYRVILQHSAHMGMIEEPELFLISLKDFLEI